MSKYDVVADEFEPTHFQKLQVMELISLRFPPLAYMCGLQPHAPPAKRVFLSRSIKAHLDKYTHPEYGSEWNAHVCCPLDISR